MGSRVVSINGRLWVEDPWEPLSDGKEEIQRLWPLASMSAGRIDLVGAPAVYDAGYFLVGEGMFKIRMPMQSGPSTKCENTIRPIQEDVATKNKRRRLP